MIASRGKDLYNFFFVSRHSFPVLPFPFFREFFQVFFGLSTFDEWHITSRLRFAVAFDNYFVGDLVVENALTNLLSHPLFLSLKER